MRLSEEQPYHLYIGLRTLTIPVSSTVFFIIAYQIPADGGFFVFGDLSVKREGEFRLRFHLFEVRKSVFRIGII